MSIAASGRARPTNWLIRCAVALGCALVLSGCVVYPGGPGYYGYYGPRPAYYGGYYGHPYYWR
jgi:hypothetical protein